MELSFLFVSLIAGMLTILAPCVIPVLPVIIGTSAVEKGKIKPLVVTGSLIISVLVFTIILKYSTSLLGISPSVWTTISGGILLFFGLITAFPSVWEKITLKLGFSNSTAKLLGSSSKKEGFTGDILVGAALGPVFTSCSPTFAIILSVILPVNFAVGFIYLLAYAFGLGVMLLLLAYAGQAIVKKLGWAIDPNGIFKRIVGAIFIVIGLAILTGLDKQLETYLLEQGLYDPFSDLEVRLQK